MIVYRLQRDGWGVFSGMGTSLLQDETNMYMVRGCSVMEARSKPRTYRFACESIDKLIEYWGTDFAHLLSQGYEVVPYKVHKAHVRFSVVKGLECAFKIDKAVRYDNTHTL